MYLTSDLPGVGGRLRAEPEDFRVWERPAYEPCGEGPHRYFDLTKRGDSTPFAVEGLARQLGVPARDIGYAGLKDRHAVTTQRISLPAAVDWTPAADRLVDLGLHTNKLKRGHLWGNRFEVRVRDVHPDGLARAQAIAARLTAEGWANFYGVQRFSRDNAEQGRRILAGEKFRGPRWKADLLVASVQSELFNLCLLERIQEGAFARILSGDVCAKLPAGGMFVGQPETEQERLERFEISYTGPIFGSRMRAAEGAAAELEARVLAAAGLTLQSFRAPGSRRRCRLPFAGSVEADGADLLFRFELPAGSYATVLLGEFMKSGDSAEEEDQGPEGGSAS